jgi:hypothetical protein
MWKPKEQHIITFFFFFMNDLTLANMALHSGLTWMLACQMRQMWHINFNDRVADRMIYLKFKQNLRTVLLKLKS